MYKQNSRIISFSSSYWSGFAQDMITKEVRIRELTILTEKLKEEHYSEYQMIQEMIEVGITLW